MKDIQANRHLLGYAALLGLILGGAGAASIPDALAGSDPVADPGRADIGEAVGGWKDSVDPHPEDEIAEYGNMPAGIWAGDAYTAAGSGAHPAPAYDGLMERYDAVLESFGLLTSLGSGQAEDLDRKMEEHEMRYEEAYREFLQTIDGLDKERYAILESFGYKQQSNLTAEEQAEMDAELSAIEGELAKSGSGTMLWYGDTKQASDHDHAVPEYGIGPGYGELDGLEARLAPLDAAYGATYDEMSRIHLTAEEMVALEVRLGVLDSRYDSVMEEFGLGWDPLYGGPTESEGASAPSTGGSSDLAAIADSVTGSEVAAAPSTGGSEAGDPHVPDKQADELNSVLHAMYEQASNEAEG